ncbi:MAG: pitrilysin family protein [Chthoniobacteraceae bacterium]
MKAPIFVAAIFTTTLLGAVAAEIEGLPAPGEPRAAKFVQPQEKTLANGLRVIVVERPGLPLVSAQVLLPTGSEADLPTAPGLAEFTAALLTQGTTTRSATQIAREVEALGATLKAKAGWDGSAVELTTLSSQLDRAFAVLADVTEHPKFAPAEIERLRRLSLDELRLSGEEPGVVARLAASRTILGRGLYAHPAKGTIASISRLHRKEIADFHATRYTAGQAMLVIAGNVAGEVAFAQAQKHFGSWKSAADHPATAAGKFEPAAKPRAILIDMPNAGQAAVVVGTPGIPRQAEDYFPGTVANTVLGGGYSSRLNEEIRLKRGLSYGVRSTLEALRAGGLFTARCQTKNESATEVVTLMRTELQRLGTEPVSEDYLATRKAVLTGDFARELETNSGYVERLADFALHGLSLDQLPLYPEQIRAVTPDAVRAFAEKHLVPGSLSVVVAGRAKDIAKPLREIFPALEVIPQAALDLESPALRRGAKH